MSCACKVILTSIFTHRSMVKSEIDKATAPLGISAFLHGKISIKLNPKWLLYIVRG